MSHLVTIEAQVKSETALQRAVERLKNTPNLYDAEQIHYKGHGSHYAYDGKLHENSFGVQLDRYHTVVFDGDRGIFDWNVQRKVDQLLQLYAVEAARLEAMARGYTCSEIQLEDGSIELAVQV